MRKYICNKEYDTETAELLHRYTYSYYGDPEGYEELLYQTPRGLYFLHVRGGILSKYPQEDIVRLAKSKVTQWIESH